MTHFVIQECAGAMNTTKKGTENAGQKLEILPELIGVIDYRLTLSHLLNATTTVHVQISI